MSNWPPLGDRFKYLRVPSAYTHYRKCPSVAFIVQLSRIFGMSIYDPWCKNAVIYCLDVEKYQDANGDGCGDFEV